MKTNFDYNALVFSASYFALWTFYDTSNEQMCIWNEQQSAIE